VLLGILCNTQVCLAVWISRSIRLPAHRVLLTMLPVAAFAAAGPLATRAASGIPDELLAKAQETAPARALVSIDDVGAATAFLALDAAKLITGETMYIDGGYHIMD
jgi:enoyl-[acyl-carrier-protein] reductase (NADH)